VLVQTNRREDRSVHIRREFAIKDNTAFDRTDLRFPYYTENSHEHIVIKSIILINIRRDSASIHLHRLTSINASLPTATKTGNEEFFNPLKLEEPKMDVTASRANSGR
jgi:hypothetical protein